MSPAITLQTAPNTANAGSIRPLQMLGALLRKEWRESHGMLLVGLIVFWLVPAMWEGLYFLIDPIHEVVAGFALFLLSVVGWFFAVIVGAVTVCRDWGRPEEHFLLSRPVSRHAAIGAKLLVGAIVVLLVSGVATAWDLGLGRAASGWRSHTPRIDDLIGMLSVAIPATCAFIVSYLLAFSLAVLTRRTLPSVLFTTLILLIWATAPLLSDRFEFFYPAWMTETHIAARTPPKLFGAAWVTMGLPFLVTVGVCILASLALAAWACMREQVVRIGPKPLAWTVALIVVALFSAAINEVGNSLAVRDQCVLRSNDPDRKVSVWQSEEWTVAARDGRCYATPWTCWSDLNHVEELASFRLDKTGRIQNLRQATLPVSEAPNALPHLRCLSGLKIDPAGRLIVTGVLRDSEPNVPSQTWIAWPEGEQPRVVSRVIVPLPMPPDQRQQILTHCAATPTHAYVVYCSVPGFPPGGPYTRPREWPRSLYVYEWSKEPNHPPTLVLGPVAWRGRADLIVDPIMATATGLPEALRPPMDIVWTYAAFSANSTERIPNDLKHLCEHWYNTEDMSLFVRNEILALSEQDRSLGRELGELGYTATAFDPARKLAYASNDRGLKVCRQNPAGAWEVVGRYYGSPLSRMMRQGTLGLFRSDESHLVEQTGASLVIYDVSDPVHPRRAGFISTASRGYYHTQAFPAQPHILLREGTMLSVLDLK